MNSRHSHPDPLPVLRRGTALLVAAGFAWSLLICCIHCSLGAMTAKAEGGGCCAANSATHQPEAPAPCDGSSSSGCLWQTEFLKGDAAMDAPVSVTPFVFDLGEPATALRSARVDAPLSAGFPPPSALRPEFSLGRSSRSHSPPGAA